jgi:hypothetical protein
MAKGKGLVRGLKAVQQQLEKHRRKKVKQLRFALLIAGLALQRESQQLVPVDTSALKNSAYTREIAPMPEHMIRVHVGYEQSYAIYVHEILDNYHAAPTTAKFLEWPARYLRKDLQAIIRKEMAKK